MPLKNLLGAVIIIFLLSGCKQGNTNQKEERPMIYEGMPASELKEILGEPDSILSGGSVYNADLEKNYPIEKWYYRSRTVVLINDTVKTPQLRER